MSTLGRDTPRIYEVDGQRIATVVDLPLPIVAREAPDWTIQIVRDPVPFDDAAVTWTGDVSQDTGRWGRFGRWQGRACVRLEGLCDLVADRATRLASLHHARGPGDDAGILRHALPYLAALDRRTVLHAASVVLLEGAVLLCAEAHTGKSTLAMALDARGHPVLGDDHVAIDVHGEGAIAYPSLPTIDTLPASRAVFRPEAAARPGKSGVSCRTTRPSDPVPVRHLVFLRRGPRRTPSRVPSAEVVRRLLLDVLFVGDPADVEEQTARFEDSVHLARAVPAHDVTVPDGLDRLARRMPEIVATLCNPRSSPSAPPSPRLDLRAAVWVAAVRVGLWMLPLERVRRLVAAAARRPRRPPRGLPYGPEIVGAAVRRATRLVPRATCLVQALAAQGLLQREGHAADLHLGVLKRDAETLAAHAWVVCDGGVVAGDGPGPHVPLGRLGLDWDPRSGSRSRPSAP